MVTLRRRPRQQRQCNIDKQADKENVVPVKTPAKQGKPGKETPKKPLKGPTPKKKTVKKGVDELENAQVNTRRSKRSRVDKSGSDVAETSVTPVTPVTPVIPVTEVSKEKTAPGGLVYEVGRRKSSSGKCEEEFVLRLSNTKAKKRRPQSAPSSKVDEPVKSTNAKKLKVEPRASKAKPEVREDSKASKTKKEISKSHKQQTPKPAAPAKTKPRTPEHPNSPTSKRKNSKSPLRLSLKPEPRSPNQIFKVPRSSCTRKQRVSVELAADVSNQEQSLGVCSIVLQKQRKRSSQGTADTPASVKDHEVQKFPLFAGISPIVPTKKEIEKLESLEKSMNLFECPMSPIQKPASKDTLNYSDLALKLEIKSLPKKTKTRPPKKTSSKTKPSKGKKGKTEKNNSLLKTPLRQTFKSKPVQEVEEEKKENSLLFGDESEESADEGGFAMFPLSDKSSWEPKPKPAANKSKTKKEPQSMDYDKWLKDHQQDYTQFQDLELCIE